MNENIDFIFSSAQQAHRASNLIEAGSLYKQVLESNPQHPFALYFLGILYGQQKSHDEAVSYLKKAWKLQPNNPEFCYNLAEAYRRKGNLAEAINYLNKTIGINPNFTEAYYALGIINKDRGNLQEAIKYYQQAISINPGHFNSYQNLGTILIIQEKYQEAHDCFKQVIQINPNNANAYNNIAITLNKTGKNEEAIEYYKQALKLNPNFIDAYNNFSNLLFKLGRTQEAFANVKAIMELAVQGIKPIDKLNGNLNINADFPQKMLIHEYTWNCCGFTDFLRSALTLQKICQFKNIEYFIHFANHPFSELFYYRKPPMTAEKINDLPYLEIFNHHLGEKCPMVVSEFLKYFDSEKIQIRVRSNYEFIEPSPAFCPMGPVLTPNEKVLRRKNQLIDELDLKPDEYNSFHVRLGDDYLIYKKSLAKEDDIQIDKIAAHIRKLIQLEPDKKLLMFSDTEGLKDIICLRNPEVLKLKTRIIHVGHDKSGTELSGFIDAICEFLIMGEGSRIYSYVGLELRKTDLTFCGFAKWCAIVHGKEYILLK